jgi:hypothetical protein
MSSPIADLCSPWATTDDLCEPCDDYDADFAALDDFLFAASNILWRLTGYQWAGFCEETVRPCAQRAVGDRPAYGRSSFTAAGGWTSSAGWAEFPWQHFCGCQSGDGCSCSHVPAITLGVEPVDAITEIRIDGVVLDPAAYRVDEWRWLVRLDGEGWPCCQSMLADPATDDDTFQVSFTFGQPPPFDGVKAAALLACEMYRACTGEGDCALDPRVTSVQRQGISMNLEQIAMQVGRSGITGLPFVDLFVESVNPHNRRHAVMIVNPDDVATVRRAGT